MPGRSSGTGFADSNVAGPSSPPSVNNSGARPPASLNYDSNIPINDRSQYPSFASSVMTRMDANGSKLRNLDWIRQQAQISLNRYSHATQGYILPPSAGRATQADAVRRADRDLTLNPRFSLMQDVFDKEFGEGGLPTPNSMTTAIVKYLGGIGEAVAPYIDNRQEDAVGTDEALQDILFNVGSTTDICDKEEVTLWISKMSSDGGQGEGLTMPITLKKKDYTIVKSPARMWEEGRGSIRMRLDPENGREKETSLPDLSQPSAVILVQSNDPTGKWLFGEMCTL